MKCSGLAHNAVGGSTSFGTVPRACKQSKRVSRRNEAVSEIFTRPLAVSILDDSYRLTQCGASGGNPGHPGQPTRKQTDGAIDPFATMEEYEDGPLDKFMISYFSKRMSQNLGGLPYEEGFQGFVQLSKEMMRGRNSLQQQQTVAGVLKSLLPPDAPGTFRRWFPFSRWTAEANAWITKVGFAWLVGPMEVQAIEVQHGGSTQTWNSGVHIKKCRYMEQTACAGICTNLCKLPTQDFFTNTFGLPLTMNPNFEDLSCEMLFGVPPPPVEQDPVYGQPCYSVCEIAQEGRGHACHRLDTNRARKGLSDAALPAAEAQRQQH